MDLFTRIQVLGRLGEVKDAKLRLSIHNLLSEHEAMRRQLERKPMGTNIKPGLPTLDERAQVKRGGPFNSIRGD